MSISGVIDDTVSVVSSRKNAINIATSPTTVNSNNVAATNQLWSLMRKRRTELEKILNTPSDEKLEYVETGTYQSAKVMNSISSSEDPCYAAIYPGGSSSPQNQSPTMNFEDNPMLSSNLRTVTPSLIDSVLHGRALQLHIEEGRGGLLSLIDSLTLDLATLIESLQLSVEEKDSKIDTLEHKVKALSDKNATQNKSMTSLIQLRDTQLKELKSQFSASKEFCTNLEGELNEKNEIVKSVDRALKSFEDRILELQTDIETKNLNLHEDTIKIATLEERLRSYELSLLDKDSIIRKLTQQLEDSQLIRNSQENEMKNLHTVDLEKDHQINALSSSVQVQQQKLIDIDTQISLLKNIIQDKEMLLKDMTSIYDNEKEHRQGLESELKITMTSLEEQTLKVVELENRSSDLVNRVVELDTTVSILKLDIATKSSELEKSSITLEEVRMARDILSRKVNLVG